jgi:hypothetical protein
MRSPIVVLNELRYTHQIEWAIHAIFHRVAADITHELTWNKRTHLLLLKFNFMKLLSIFLTPLIQPLKAQQPFNQLRNRDITCSHFCSIISANTVSCQHSIGTLQVVEETDFHTRRITENVLNKNRLQQPRSASPATSE